MNENYSIQEILLAIEDLNKLKKAEKKTIIRKTIKNKIDNNIPPDTLKLIEEAEKN
tara:strand:- start:278 stop:445 length:168 start_codon:yes stop_codon:yes gene_type:complete